LNVLGMISYVLLFSYNFTNKCMSKFDSFCVENIAGLTKHPLGFLGLTICLYGFFFANQTDFTLMFGSMLTSFTSSSTSSSGGINVMTSFMNVLSTFFAPFLSFFYVIFAFVYGISLLGCIIGYWNYANCSSSYLVKLLCGIGMIIYPGVLIVYLLSLSASGGNFKSLIQNIFNTLKTKAMTYLTQIQSIETQATDLENDLTSSL